ncbi:MAG TPA: hypothetical protein VN776_06945 [Terracidiphilus sp.]|nr:hypothetical protein [Terracidiphilus sp.]
MNPVIQIRIIQFVMILSALSLIPFSRMQPQPTHTVSATFQLIIVLVAAASAESGFTVQRKMLRVRGQSNASTPLTRWRAGQIIRLATAYSVILYALVLRILGGSSKLAGALYVSGLLLLLIWRPGVIPTDTPSQRSAG